MTATDDADRIDGKYDDASCIHGSDSATTDVVVIDDYDIDRSASALFAGDEGGLSRDQRDCLIYLLKNHYLSHDQRPALWQVLVEHQPTIRSRLNDLYLTLHVDIEGQVAYKRRAVPDNSGDNFPTLLHDRAYNLEQTILLVYLRERLHRQRAVDGGQVLVDRQDMLDRVAEFRAADETDLSGAEKRADNAIEALKGMGVVHATADSERFTISPVLDSLMPLTRLQELLEWLRTETGQSGTGPDEDDADR